MGEVKRHHEALLEPESMTSPVRIKLRNVHLIRDQSPSVLCPTEQGLKWLSLFILTIQNATQVLVMRYARTRPTEMFLSTTAVFWNEIVKLIACVVIVSIQEKSITGCLRQISDTLIKRPIDTLKVCVPSVVYTLQNNLIFVAVSNLDAATFMVTFQLKILTTALFAVAMLRKPLSRIQWFSLLILFIGVSVVQLQQQGTSRTGITAAPASRQSGTGSPADAALTAQQNPWWGFTCVLAACLMSGFAGVYFEKILKGSDVTVWMRNIQLSVLSIPISLITMELNDGAVISKVGMFYGYDLLVWGIIFLYALGGLTVAVVVKYADNILKGFATSISIIVSCVASIYLFDFVPSVKFLIGTGLVTISVLLYSKYPASTTNSTAHRTISLEQIGNKDLHLGEESDSSNSVR